MNHWREQDLGINPYIQPRKRRQKSNSLAPELVNQRKLDMAQTWYQVLWLEEMMITWALMELINMNSIIMRIQFIKMHLISIMIMHLHLILMDLHFNLMLNLFNLILMHLLSIIEHKRHSGRHSGKMQVLNTSQSNMLITIMNSLQRINNMQLKHMVIVLLIIWLILVHHSYLIVLIKRGH